MDIISNTEQGLIDRFEAAYNRIQSHMQDEVNGGSYAQFGKLVSRMKDSGRLYNRRFRFLMDCASLRNHIVHEKMQPGEYMAVPRASIVERLETIADEMDKPPVVAMFNKKVQTFRTDDTISAVLEIIHQNDFSQFPVYDESEQFTGLLTENGITRWLADNNRNQEADLVNLAQPVAQALAVEEMPDNHLFVSRHMTVVEAVNIYARKPQLEALLITESGDKQQSLLGIMTRFDALDIIDDELHAENDD